MNTDSMDLVRKSVKLGVSFVAVRDYHHRCDHTADTASACFHVGL